MEPNRNIAKMVRVERNFRIRAAPCPPALEVIVFIVIKVIGAKRICSDKS